MIYLCINLIEFDGMNMYRCNRNDTILCEGKKEREEYKTVIYIYVIENNFSYVFPNNVLCFMQAKEKRLIGVYNMRLPFEDISKKCFDIYLFIYLFIHVY